MFNKKHASLLYDFHWEEFNSQNTEEHIKHFLEVGTPKSSCWFSNLAPYIKGFESFKAYIRFNHMESLKGGDLKSSTTSRTAKTCPAIKSILTNSILIKCPSDIMITIDSENNYRYNTPESGKPPLVTVESHAFEQLDNSKSPTVFKGYLNLKFKLAINIGNTSGVPLIFLHPWYHSKLPFDVLNGVLEGGREAGVALNINTIVKVPKGSTKEVFIKAGTVIAYLWSPRPLQLVHCPTLTIPVRHKFSQGGPLGN
jgi:hypothetical protein